MERREFLLKSVEASLLAYLPAVGAFAAKKDSSALAPDGLVPALNPVSMYVQSYTPPAGILAVDHEQTLSFDVVGWHTDKGRQNVVSPLLGEAVVARHPRDKEVLYEVTLRNGEDEALTGRFHCRKDPLRTLESWDFVHALNAKTPTLTSWTQTRCSGECTGKQVVVRTDGVEATVDIEGPLLCRWGLLDATAHFADLCSEARPHAVLETPSGLRTGQHFAADQQGRFPSGEANPIRTFLQTGPATLPTHWIVDDAGRPLFITAFLTSWALKAIG